MATQIFRTSFFKDPANDINWFEDWAYRVGKHSNRQYNNLTVETSLGKTRIWGHNIDLANKHTLVIFPGARTSALFWDLDRGLDNFAKDISIYLVETNGLPNSSDGSTPDIKGYGYGEWAAEVFEKLGIKEAFIAGASFGGLVCMKMAIVSPEKIKAAILLNPGCLQFFSLSFKNLYYNLLPILSPSERNIRKLLDAAVFSKPYHRLSEAAEKLLVEYELFAITRYKDKTQKPYYMGKQLREVRVPIYLLEGDKDLLFPFEKSIKNAKDNLSTLAEVKVFENVGHGIETYAPALQYANELIKSY